MTADPEIKKLLRILVGAAWIDGKVQPEERKYLHQVADRHGIADDPELQPWLSELKSVSPAECQGWVKEYLGDRPTVEDCHQLIEAISGLMYSDGDIANEEAELLTQLQLFEPQVAPEQRYAPVLKAVQKLYRRWAN